MNNSETIVIPLVFGVGATLIVMVNQIFGNVLRRRYLHRERMAALEKGVPLPDDILADLGADRAQHAPRVGLQGVVWTSLGVGLLISSMGVRSTQLGADINQFLDFLSIWAFPAVTVGVGLMLYAWFTRPRSPRI